MRLRSRVPGQRERHIGASARPVADTGESVVRLGDGDDDCHAQPRTTSSAGGVPAREALERNLAQRGRKPGAAVAHVELDLVVDGDARTGDLLGAIHRKREMSGSDGRTNYPHQPRFRCELLA